MAVKAKVTVAKKSTESGDDSLSISSSFQNRTPAQIKKANLVMKAGKGRWFTSEATQLSKDIFWFHDGLLGWHLKKSDPKPVTEKNWSMFSPDELLTPPKTYEEVDSPFKKPVKK